MGMRPHLLATPFVVDAFGAVARHYNFNVRPTPVRSSAIAPPRRCRPLRSKSPRADINWRSCAITFAPGTDVTITFLSGDDYRHNVEAATALRSAGYNPVPHIAAREMASREALDDFLAWLRGEAGVTRILLISGDTAPAGGPFKSSLDVRASGLLEARGITRLGVAGHPEGHPYLETAEALDVLDAWREWGHERKIHVEVMTQFCFESGHRRARRPGAAGHADAALAAHLRSRMTLQIWNLNSLKKLSTPRLFATRCSGSTRHVCSASSDLNSTMVTRSPSSAMKPLCEM